MQSNGAKSPLFHLRGRSISGKALQRSDSNDSPTWDFPISSPSAASEKPLTPGYGPSTPQLPSAKALIEGYRPSPIDTNATSQKRPRSSDLLNISDPVAMHLLVETAIGDARDFEVLSLGELDGLKKELALTSAKVESVRRKLAMESKVKEAAQSLLRLYTKRGKHSSAGSVTRPKKNNSLSGTPVKPGSSGGENSTIDKTEEELAASTRKCEELAAELWRLERRAADIQGKIWRHTAGILQMTRKGPSSKRDRVESVQPMWPLLPEGTSRGVVPRSPESIFTYDNARGSGVIDFGDEFGDRSLYIEPGDAEAFEIVERGQNGLNTQSHSRSTNDSELDRQRQELEGHSKAYASLESRLAELNHRLRDLLLQANPERYQHYSLPPTLSLDDQQNMGVVETTFEHQLDYLEHGLDNVSEEQYGNLQNLRHSETVIESKLHDMNDRVYTIINSSGMQSEPPYPSPPPTSDTAAPEAQINYLEDGLETMQQLHHELIRMLQDSSSTHTAEQERAQQYDLVLNKLWDVLVANEEQSVKRTSSKGELLASSAELPTDFDHGLANEGRSVLNDEGFTLQAFSARVERLCQRLASMKEQNAVLTDQIEQQKELYKNNEEQKVKEIEELEEQIEAINDRHVIAVAEARGLRLELGEVQRQLDAAKQQVAEMQQSHTESMRDSEAWTTEREAWQRKEDELSSDAERKQERIEMLEKIIAELDDDMQAAEAEREEKAAEYQQSLEEKEKRIEGLADQLGEARSKHEETASRVIKFQSELEASQVSHTEKLQDKERRIEELGRIHQEARAAHEETTSRVSALQSELEALQASNSEEVANREKKIKELEQMLQHARMAHDETTSRAADLQSELEALQTSHDEEVANRERRIEELGQMLQHARTAHEETTSRAVGLQSELEALHTSHTKELEGKTKLIEELDMLLQDSRTAHDETTFRAADLQYELEGLQGSHMELKSHVKELEAQLNSVRTSQEEATTRAKDLQSQLEETERDKAETTARITDLESQLTSLSESHSKAIDQATELESQLSALKTSHKDVNSRAASLESQLSETESHARSLESHLDGLRTSHNHVLAHGNYLQSQLDAANSTKTEATTRIADLEAQISSLNLSYSQATTQAANLDAQLSALKSAHNDATSRAANLESQLSNVQSSHNETSTRATMLEDELRNLESEVVRLQTDLTIAKAELDGAYGSRAQRAAEVAANPEIRNQLDELGQRNAMLIEELERIRSEKDATARERDQGKEFMGLVQAARDESGKRVEALENELKAVVAELEALVAEGVRMEREREGMEAEVDKLHAKCEGLEEKLEAEKIKHLGLGNMVNGEHGAEGEGRGMAALRAEFKKLMRESRMDFVRALRAEHDERRRLEATIRTLRKDQQSSGRPRAPSRTVMAA